MSCLPSDTRLDALVREVVTNYGQYTGNVVGLGHGRVDRVLEVPVVPTADWEYAYTKTPMISAYKLAYGTTVRVRSFVYVIPLETRDGREQRMLVGSDGEDLDIATFFRPVGLASSVNVASSVYVAMPSKAFAGQGDEVEYAFRVRNYVELSNGTMVPIPTLQVGMEYTTSTQRKHATRGVMLITNDRMFSAQLGEKGDRQAGFRLQYVAQTSMADAAPVDAKATLHTQAFGFVARPQSGMVRLSRYVRSHFHFCPRRLTKSVGATRSGGMTRGGTRGGSSLSHGKLLAGETRVMNVTASDAVPIAERETVEFCLTVGDVSRVFHEKAVEAVVNAPEVVDLTGEDEVDKMDRSSYAETMHCLARMMSEARNGSEEHGDLRQVIEDMFSFPTLRVVGPLGLLAPSSRTPLAVGVKRHEDEDDEEGEVMSMTSGGTDVTDVRVYTAEVGPLYRVRLTNFSLSGDFVKVTPCYYRIVDGFVAYDEPEAAMTIEPVDTFEVPFPLEKKAGEFGVDGWIFKDDQGLIVLRISFAVDPQVIDNFFEVEERTRIEREREAAEKAERENIQQERDAMLVDGPGGAPNAPECCVCMTQKSLKEIVVFAPCGHGVCCATCYTRIVATDSAAGRRSTCPKCRVAVQDVVRVYF